MCLPFNCCRSRSNATAPTRCVIVAINIDGWRCCVVVGEREEADEVYAVVRKILDGEWSKLPSPI